MTGEHRLECLPARGQRGDRLTRAVVRFHLGPEPADTVEAAQQAAERVLGRVGGIISACDPVGSAEELAPVHLVAARGPRRMSSWSFPEPALGVGTSTDASIARLAAVAEALESYCSMAPPEPAALERGAFRDLEGYAVRPDTVVNLSWRQYRRCPTIDRLTDTKVIDWTWTYSLTQDRPLLFPAALVHFGLDRALNNFVGGLVSTGFACHVCLSRAILTGLCEVLERDALAVAWHARLPLRPLAIDGTEVQEVISGPLARFGVVARAFLVPTDGPFPVVLVRGESRNAGPHAVVGIACRPEPVAAALKAALEVCQVLVGLRRQRPSRPVRLRHLYDSAAFYASSEGAALLDRHLITAGEPRPLAEVSGTGSRSAATELRRAIRRLAESGLEVLVAEATTADVAATGWRVLRVVVPGAVDISADPRLAPLGARRLREVPTRLGLRRRPLTVDHLNHLPVPLA